jgi:hypothetical protein
MQPERKVKASKIVSIIDCGGSRNLFLKVGSGALDPRNVAEE